MRLLAIGDIHGCLRAFTTLLDAVEPQSEDRIITLGDYVDRGPDSRGVLDRLIALHATGRLIALRGNHDVMMLEARNGPGMMWLECGGKQALASYGIADWQINALRQGEGWFGVPDEFLGKIPARHWKFLEEDCLPYYETDKHIFVHANVYPDLALDEQPDYMLYWEKLIEPCDHISGKILICGHTRQKSGLPLDLGTSICIDTGAYDEGWLTCLDVLTGRIWQANELGKARTGWLDQCTE
ncbi:MAG TPA: metallophosphoesterase family protein [Gemmataceae bacterium]|nr:metallophosphoesterase family protein [Gemmataceae bacterium]